MEGHTCHDVIIPGENSVTSATLRVKVYALSVVDIGRFGGSHLQLIAVLNKNNAECLSR